jgi:hypothetical protein
MNLKEAPLSNSKGFKSSTIVLQDLINGFFSIWRYWCLYGKCDAKIVQICEFLGFLSGVTDMSVLLGYEAI